MAKGKKKLSKKAKAARKVLENSKLLQELKIKNSQSEDQGVKPASTSIKTATAYKIRPDKKRG
jgi:hypothetical protein